MDDLTIEELLEKYPYLKDLTNRFLITTRKDIYNLLDGDEIIIDSQNVSMELLERIIKNDEYYHYTIKYFSNEIDQFAITYIENGDTNRIISYDKCTIIKGIEKLINSGNIKIENEEEKKRFETLKENISYSKFKNHYINQKYDIEIDNIKYSIPISEFISLMELQSIEFNDLCFNNENKKIYDIPKEHFIYALIKFFRENKIIKNYLIPESIINHYYDISSFKNIDIEAINKYLETIDTKHKMIKINDSLKKAILLGMPNDANDLEKALYIYIKMCKMFTYDDEYYAVNQKGEATLKHKNINYISTITLNNNKIVCYEFNLMYAYFLSELGINFVGNYGENKYGMENPFGETSYGEGHSYLKFRVGKFLVSADSVISILQGDLVRAKLNQPLEGIICTNINRKTYDEFKSSLSKMYQLVANQEKNSENVKVEHEETLEELLEEYKLCTKNIREISLEERFEIIINKLNSIKLVGIDTLGYLLQLRNILFLRDREEDNFLVTILRNNEPFEEGKYAMSSAIITLYKNGEYNYYYFNPNHKPIMISQSEIQEKFDKGIFKYIREDTPKIPGIVEGGLKK